MLKNMTVLLASFLLIAVLCPYTSSVAGVTSGKTLIIGTKDAPPFSMKTEDGKWTGISIELWRQIAQDLNLSYEYRETDIQGLIEGVRDGSLDAAVAAMTALPIGFFIYRSLNFRILGNTLVEAASIMGAVTIVFFFIFMLSRVLAWERFTESLSAFVFSVSTSKYVVLAMLNVTLLIMGMLMDDVSGTILAAVVLLPVAREIGVSAVHFAAIVSVNMGLGNVTPPVAPLLYMAGRIGGNLPLNRYIKPASTFMILGSLPVLILTTYVPSIPLFLPHLLYGYPIN